MSTTNSQPAAMEAGRILHAAGYVGAGSGIIGSFGYATWATFNGSSMLFHSMTGGIYGFLLGGSFWTSRCVLEDVLKYGQILQEHHSSRDLALSTVSGAIAGGAVNSINGRAAIKPGAMIFGLVGLLGQGCFTAAASRSITAQDDRPLLDKLSEKGWWPLKKMTDAEYEEYLVSKLIAVEADIEMVDERLEVLRQSASLPVPKR